MLLVWLVLAAFAVMLFLLFSAMIEMYRTVQQLREETGVNDAPVPLDLAAEPESLRSAGLPDSLLGQEQAVVLVLSDRCGTCEQLASTFKGRLPNSVWVLFVPKDGQSGQEWLARHGLSDEERVIWDLDDRISQTLEVQIAPAALRLRSGVLVAAHTLTSARRLEAELGWLSAGGPDRPSYAGSERSYEKINSIKKQLEAT